MRCLGYSTSKFDPLAKRRKCWFSLSVLRILLWFLIPRAGPVKPNHWLVIHTSDAVWSDSWVIVKTTKVMRFSIRDTAVSKRAVYERVKPGSIIPEIVKPGGKISEAVKPRVNQWGLWCFDPAREREMGTVACPYYRIKALVPHWCIMYEWCILY